MPRRHLPDDEASSEFRRAVEDATPLEGREKLAPRPVAVRRRRPRPDDPSAPALEVERLGERIEGHVPDLDPALLRKLRSREFAIDARADLHGLDREGARRLVHETLTRAHAEGGRCVLVVHGRGRGSADGPVLKEALPGWLSEPPAGPLVLAFTSAAGRDGGVGATYVLLRR